MTAPIENVSKLVLKAVVCGVAGPLAALVALHTVSPVVLGSSVENPDYLGDWIIGAVLSMLILSGAAAFCGVAATLAAFVLTDCPHALVGWASSVALTLLWSRALDGVALSFTAYVLLLGVVPAMLRVGFGLLPQAGLSAPTTHIAKN